MANFYEIANLQGLSSTFNFVRDLGHRDVQALRQMIQNFSVAFSYIRKKEFKVLEIGAGLSTVVIAELLSRKNDGSKLFTLDYLGLEAFICNTRGSNIDVEPWIDFVDIVTAPTVSLAEIESFYCSSTSTIGGMSKELLVDGLDPFIEWSMDDRRHGELSRLTKQGENYSFFSNNVKRYLLDNELFNSDLFQLYRHNDDEFDILSKNHFESGELASQMQTVKPDLVYMDSGEFSSNVEFNVIEPLLGVGATLIVQDIFFPKSIKSFLICAYLAMSNQWQVVWVDRTTPQGVLIAKKIG